LSGYKNYSLSNCSIDIIIEFPQSYKYDLKNEVYSVYYMNKPPTNIKFHLSTIERRLIEKNYYSLGIDKLKIEGKKSTKIFIKDKCMTMPKDYFIIHITHAGTYQEIKIDASCDNFYAWNINNANRLKQFIKLILDIIYSKPAVKNAPKSDILYM